MVQGRLLRCLTPCARSDAGPRDRFGWVLQVLRRSEGALQLLDVSAQLPHLQRVPGLHKWLVKGAGSGLLSSWGEAEAAGQVGLLVSM